MSLQEPIIIGSDEIVLEEDYSQCALEIGCGQHPTTGYNLSLDIDRDNQPTVVADANHIPFRDGIFQRVCLFEVLEHTSCPMLVLNEVNRVMQFKGFLELSVPNIYHFGDTFLWILSKSIPVTHEHINSWRAPELSNLLQRCGFTVVTVDFINRVWFNRPSRIIFLFPKRLKCHSLFIRAIKLRK